jgi:hypothetical protein
VSLNAERSGHWSTRHRHTDAWRERTALTARQSLRRIDDDAFPIYVEAFPVQKGKTPDAGNCYPTVKAIVDGLRDAQIIPDDDPTYVQAIILQAPVRPTAGMPEHVTIHLWTEQ